MERARDFCYTLEKIVGNNWPGEYPEWGKIYPEWEKLIEARDAAIRAEARQLPLHGAA